MILMIDNYDSFTYNLVQEFGMLGADVKVVRNDQVTCADIDALKPAALVLSPGPGTPDSAGGRIVAAQKLMHGKTSRLRHDGQGLFRGFPQSMEAMRYHSLAVERATLPDCFKVSAVTEDDGEIMGLRHRTLPIESIQYHPESIGTPNGINQLQNFLELVKECGK